MKITEQETFLTTNEAYKYLKEKIEESDKEFVEIKELKTLLFNGEFFIVTFIDNDGYLSCYGTRISNINVVFYEFLAKTYKKNLMNMEYFLILIQYCLSKLINFATICHLYLFMTLITTVMINYWFFQFQEWEFFTRFYHLIL